MVQIHPDSNMKMLCVIFSVFFRHEKGANAGEVGGYYEKRRLCTYPNQTCCQHVIERQGISCSSMSGLQLDKASVDIHSPALEVHAIQPVGFGQGSPAGWPPTSWHDRLDLFHLSIKPHVNDHINFLSSRDYTPISVLSIYLIYKYLSSYPAIQLSSYLAI